MLPNNIEVLIELSIIDSNTKKSIAEFAIVKYIEYLEGLLAEVESYLIAAEDGSMSKNNSEQLAYELLDRFPLNGRSK